MLTDIFCPHCGGQMEIDTAQRLQAMLSCPYCGRKSLMQKTDDTVQLRGIILPAAFGGIDADGSADTRTTAPEARSTAAEPRAAATETRTVTMAPDTGPTAPEARTIGRIPNAMEAAEAAETRESMAAPALGNAPAESPLEHLIQLAQQSLAAGQMLAFNSYARQAIDCNPCDPRMHVLRARLTEEAHGFARATFLSPGWAEQTPRQRGWAMAQHFSTFNAAIACSPESAHGPLAGQTGILIARQIRDTFLDRARLRLGRKAFRGHYRPGDLRQAPLIIETCLAIDDTIVPKVSSRLMLAIREELARLDPALARLLQRRGL